MKVNVTYLNEYIEFLEPMFGERRAAELLSASRLYNRTLGPITSLNLVRPDVNDLPMYSAYCHHAPLEALIADVRLKSKPSLGLVPGGGKGATLLRPALGALGEMAERLLGMLHFTAIADRILFGTYDQLRDSGRTAPGPSELPLFADEQYDSPGFEFARYTPTTPLGWIDGYDLTTGEQVWVPAQLVLMYYRPRLAEANIGYATTAGLAFQTSRRAALVHGLCEVIERDALNIRWYSRLVPARVEVDVCAALGIPRGGFRTAAPPDGFDLGVYDLTLDSPVPVIAAIGVDHARQDRAFVGGTGAAPDRTEALAQAMFELGQCQTGFHFEDPFGRLPILPDADERDVVEFFDAPLYYGHRSNIGRVDWFRHGTDEVSWDHLPQIEADDDAAFAVLADWAARSGLRPIVFDFDAACPAGMSIIKVYVPGLTHACPPRNPMLGHPRFRNPPTAASTGPPLGFGDLCSDPIPFA